MSSKQDLSQNTSRTQGIVVFSGGSAANSLVDVFKEVATEKKCQLSYVIPISDNGGSSSELIRVFGGPGRLVRLIPEDPYDKTRAAIRRFFNHRLSADPDLARLEWLEIVEARHSSSLWDGIPSSKRELIRPFLNLLNAELVKRLRPSSTFKFSHASIGNMFLTGARLFTGSLESSIQLLTLICQVHPSISVLPIINTNFTNHISAGLRDGSVITGQNAISHPSVPTAVPDSHSPDATKEMEEHDAVEDANLPGTLPSLRRQQIIFSKTHEEPLNSRIERIWYINPYGQEIRLAANPRVLDDIKNAQTIIFSIGSLYTSIAPSLIAKGVGEALLTPSVQNKCLILNSSIDRETGSVSGAYSATDFIAAIADACLYSQGLRRPARSDEYRMFVTQLLYLEGPGAPVVNTLELLEMGIQCLRLYGRPDPSGLLRYDERALIQALGTMISNGEGRSRRNTLQR